MSDEQRMVLRTEDLVKKYRMRTVVNHVSINVKQGEIVGLLGPNGAGKTTTFYMTVGLVLNATSRHLQDRADIIFHRHFPENRSLLRQITNAVASPLIDREFRNLHVIQEEKLESLISEFGLNKVRKNLGDQLSGGERRRAEIARCLAIDPKFIMLDEPFAGVDPIAVQDIQTIVARLKHKNIGILITDHNVYETLSICDRAYLLFEGKVLFQGTAEQLAENEIVREKYLGKDFVLRKKDL